MRQKGTVTKKTLEQLFAYDKIPVSEQQKHRTEGRKGNMQIKNCV